MSVPVRLRQTYRQSAFFSHLIDCVHVEVTHCMVRSFVLDLNHMESWTWLNALRSCKYTHTHTDNCFIMVVLHSQIVDVGLTTCKMLQIHSLIQWVIHKGQRSKGHLSGVSLINQGRQRRNTQCTLTKFLSFHLAKRTFIVYIYVENGQICPLKYFIDNI